MKKTDFNPNWITTEKMTSVKPVNLFHRMKHDTAVKDCGVKNYHVHFRKKFTCRNKDNIKIRISADDYYKLYINGKFVCQGPASAYYTSYKYNEIDISEYIRDGNNIISVHFFTAVLLTVFQTAETADSVLRHKYFPVIKFCLKLILHGSAPKRQNSAVKPWGMILLFLKTLISGNPKKGGQNMCLMTANMKMLLY